MMERKVLILEDHRHHREALEKILGEIGTEISCYCAATVKEALQIIWEVHIHLFLIDIVLDTREPGDVSGLNFVKQIREISKYKHTPLIFITSLEDPKLFSFHQLHCYSYIEKPFDVGRTRQIIKEALEVPVVEDDDRYVYFQKDGIAYSVYIKDIICIKSSRRMVTLYFSDSSLDFPYKTCREVLQDLDSTSFIQSSRNYIVNKKYIEYIDRTNRFVKMKYMEEPIEIGAVMKKSFMEKMAHG